MIGVNVTAGHEFLGVGDEEAAEAFFSPELRDPVTGLYGVAPTIDFLEIAEIVDNSTR